MSQLGGAFATDNAASPTYYDSSWTSNVAATGLGNRFWTSIDVWINDNPTFVSDGFPNGLRFNTIDGLPPLSFGDASVLANPPTETYTLVGPITKLYWDWELDGSD